MFAIDEIEHLCVGERDVLVLDGLEEGVVDLDV
jgi:hypothetical protein